MIYKPRSFRIEELVPKAVFDKRGEKAWELINPELSVSVQAIKDYTNCRVTINDYLWGGIRNNQCFRTADFYDGFSLSQHLRGDAADPLIEGMSPEESRELIIYMKKNGKLDYVTAMEDEVNWLHIDCRPCEREDETGLFIFKP